MKFYSLFMVLLAATCCPIATVFASAIPTYDTLGRITRVDLADGSSISYIYDANGNPLDRIVTRPPEIVVTVAPPGAGTVTGAGVTLMGNQASLSATPASGFLFHDWSEGGVTINTDPTLTFTVSTSRALTASFVTATALGSWRLTYFGTVENVGNAADTATPQSDGITNLMKFATGMDPTRPGLNPGTSIVNGSNITFIYARNKSAMSDGLTFTVEWSDDLSPLSWSATNVTEASLDQGTTEQVTALIPKGSAGRRFVRLRVVGQTTTTTEPVGFNEITSLGNSDTRFSVPFHRSTAYQGAVQSVSDNVISTQGSPNWTTNQFVYASGSQPNHFYVEFGSGSREGVAYTVSANDTASITVDLNGDTLQGSVAAGDIIRIIPFWTFSTLFPSGTGITGTDVISGSGSLTRVFVPDLSSAGTNLAASSSYYYYTGSAFGGPGWRKQGGGFANIKDDEPISPDLYVTVRQDGVATNVLLTGKGAVPITTAGSTLRSYLLGTLQSNLPQDNALAPDIPLPLTLAASNLYTGPTGAFVGTTSISGSSGDKVLVFDDSVPSINKAASKSYYYYTGTGFGGAGWRLQGGGFTTIRDNEIVFRPGSGVIIRKEATPAPTFFIWNIPLAY